MNTFTSPYDFSTIFGDFYKTAYHYSNEIGPGCENEHFHTGSRPPKTIRKVVKIVESFSKLSEFTDLVYDLR